MTYYRPHHKTIKKILEHFNIDYLTENNILFGGGTRIALELDEYRKSVDIDFLCMNTPSYKAVRTQACNVSLGNILSDDLTFAREIRCERSAVRTFVNHDDINVKLEFVAFDDYQLTPQLDSPFSVPCIDHDSCYITKLLAHSDRKHCPERKDFFDLLMMFKCWGMPGENVWHECERHYGESPLIDLIGSLRGADDAHEKIKSAGVAVDIKPKLLNELITTVKNDLLRGLDLIAVRKENEHQIRTPSPKM
jgi:hypothetical protein